MRKMEETIEIQVKDMSLEGVSKRLKYVVVVLHARVPMMFVRGLSQLIRSTFHPLEEQIRRECVAGNISEAMIKFRKLLDSDVMPSQECLGYLLHYSRVHIYMHTTIGLCFEI